MTLPQLKSTTAELIAYRDELNAQISKAVDTRFALRHSIAHWHNLILEVLDELSRREACEHLDFADTLSGQKCLACGFEMDIPDEEEAPTEREARLINLEMDKLKEKNS